MAVATKSKEIDKRYDFILLFDVEQGNPNGDPDAGNQPRVDPETGHGIVTDVCLKRKIRDYVHLVRNDSSESPQPGYEIYVKHRGILANEQKRAYVAVGADPMKLKKDDIKEAQQWMCSTFFDVRTFGAVMTTGKAESEDKKSGKLYNCGQVRGPIQLTFGRSIDPIVNLEHAITRVALTNPGDTSRRGAELEEGDEERARSGQMGRKHTIPYALYQAHGFVSPQLARQTGFSASDLDLLWEALVNMFEFDRSAARGLMATRKLLIFEHGSPLGSAPAHKLFDLVTVSRASEGKPPRSFRDYTVEVDSKTATQLGVQVIVKP